MFDADMYRELCSELHLSEQRLQEVIQMTEQQKKRLRRRPLRVGLVAAAICAALAVTASAANPELLEGIVMSIRSSVVVNEYREDMVTESGETITALRMPETAVEERDGRMFLTVDGEEVDITEDMERDGEYLWTFEDEGTKVQVEVYLDENGVPQTISSVAPAEGSDYSMSLISEDSGDNQGH